MVTTSPMPSEGLPNAGDKIRKSPQMSLVTTSLLLSRGQGGPQRFKAGDEIRSAPHMGRLATPPLQSRGPPTLQSSGQNQKWPINGPGDYITHAMWRVSNASKHGPKLEGGQKWASWLHHPCSLEGVPSPQRFTAGEKIRSAPQVALVATSPLPYGGSDMLYSGGQKHKCPIRGRGGYIATFV